MQKKLLTIVCFLLIGFALTAQTNATRIEGLVLEANIAAAPVDFATVILSPSGLQTVTNAKGEFVFSRVDAGRASIKIVSLGMVTIDTIVNVTAGQVNKFVFRMREENFRLSDVVVVATQNKAGQSTSSNISRQAIDHMQASTLRDVMQLMPGVAVTNPTFASDQTVSIRGTGNANSLGTAIIVDGAQMSNNANLQTMRATISGTTGIAAMLNTDGDINASIDTRILSLDNVESIEIVRGIPSVEYGDLTSGAVIIKSKAGKNPLQVRFKTTPEIYQGSLSKGFGLGEKWGTFNLSGDYVYSIKKPTEAYATYQRFAAKGLWTNTFGKSLLATTSLDLSYGEDSRSSNPDDQDRNFKSSAREFGVALNHNGTININKGWLKSIEYLVSGRYNDKNSWEREKLPAASGMYSTAMVDGAIVSLVRGEKVYDSDGNEITKLNGQAFGKILPDSYMSDWNIFGKEINAQAKLKVNFHKSWGNISNRIVIGADYKTDGNVGKGRVYDEEFPPQRIASSGGRAYRERPFSEVPFVHHLGLFAEDRYQHFFGEHELQLTAGARFDYINGKNVLAPRINASLDILPKLLTLRGGYGITAKMPTLLYLYPEKAYFDYRLTPSSLSNDILLIETRIFDVSSEHLKIATNRKYEIGLDLKLGKRRLSLTYYDELRENDYSLSSSLNTIKLVKHQPYVMGATGLEPGSPRNIFAIYYEPSNNTYNHNRGIEAELDLGRFDAIRTSFFLNGAWTKNIVKRQGLEFTSDGNMPETHIGIYDKYTYGTESERIIATLRVTHNIPAIGFVVTLTAQARLMDKERYNYYTNWQTDGCDMIDRYISKVDGKVYDFDPAWRNDPDFVNLMQVVNTVNNPMRTLAQEDSATIFFNINLSKEISDYFTASFFANNMFNSRPLVKNTRTPGSVWERGSDIFFGFELKISIK